MKPAIELAKFAIAYGPAIGVFFPAFAHQMAELGSAVMAEEGVRYWISPGGDSITCTKCRMTSRNPSDVEQRYCGKCHVFHRNEKPDEIREAHVRAHQSFDWLMAAYLIHNRGKLPSTTTLTELMEWSFEQTKERDATQ